MTRTSHHRSRLTAAVCLVAVGALTAGTIAVASSGHPPASSDTTTVQRFFSHQVSFVFTHADGTVAEPTEAPVAGDRIEFTELAYRGNHEHHARRWTLSSHTVCTFQATGGPVCDGQAAVGRSQLILFHTTDATGTLVTGGTGRYAGATGDVAMTQIGESNDSDFVMTLHLRH